jgi:glycine/D-amino acid oxidase-like deaminating enzyme
MPKAKAVLKYPSGSVHSHKLVSAFLRTALSSPLVQAFSFAPVKGFTRSDGIWQVDAGERGTASAKEVVVCTNAHTGWLFEGTDVQEQYVLCSRREQMNDADNQLESLSRGLCADYSNACV